MLSASQHARQIIQDLFSDKQRFAVGCGQAVLCSPWLSAWLTAGQKPEMTLDIPSVTFKKGGNERWFAILCAPGSRTAATTASPCVLAVLRRIRPLTQGFPETKRINLLWFSKIQFVLVRNYSSDINSAPSAQALHQVSGRRTLISAQLACRTLGKLCTATPALSKAGIECGTQHVPSPLFAVTLHIVSCLGATHDHGKLLDVRDFF